ncbi:hypothetical protein ACIQXA_24115 [Streptomyces massasporeus]|uniref:hypothetical protein n=1 Tax=Streptomyces massasporeus TaxID=67324 RepID=UPI0037F5DE78
MRAAAGACFGGGLQVAQPRLEALAEGLGRGGDVRFDLVAGPGLLGCWSRAVDAPLPDMVFLSMG